MPSLPFGSNYPCLSVFATVPFFFYLFFRKHSCFFVNILVFRQGDQARSCTCVIVFLRFAPSLLPCHIMSMSCHVTSSNVMSCRVMPCRVVSHHVMSCRLMSCRFMSFRGQIPKECSSDYAKLLTSPLMSLLCKNSGKPAEPCVHSSSTGIAVAAVRRKVFQIWHLWLSFLRHQSSCSSTPVPSPVFPGTCTALACCPSSGKALTPSGKARLSVVAYLFLFPQAMCPTPHLGIGCVFYHQ